MVISLELEVMVDPALEPIYTLLPTNMVPFDFPPLYFPNKEMGPPLASIFVSPLRTISKKLVILLPTLIVIPPFTPVAAILRIVVASASIPNACPDVP